MQAERIKPYTYHQASATWQSLSHMSPGLQRGTILTLASWNLDCSSPDPAARTLAALAYLKSVFSSNDENLVIMLQEISLPFLDVILKHSWVQDNFIPSDIRAAKSSRVVSITKRSTLKRSAKESAPYFPVIMAQKTLPVLGCFRVPFMTNFGRDVLAFDILSRQNASGGQECIRLCTTHLESLSQGHMYRQGQLAIISEIFKNSIISDRKVIAGIVVVI